MAKPTDYPLWATVLNNEVKTIEGNTVTIPNRDTIPTDYSDDGILFGETVHRKYLNQVLHLTSLWVDHLDKRIETGHVHLDNVETSAVNIGLRFGGTWTARGTQTIGTLTANVFEKTA